MSRRLLLIAAASFGLSLLLFAHREAQSQPRSGSDTIRFMAAVRGSNYDGTGLKWCVSQSWHETYPPGPASNPYPQGPRDGALDEVSQTGPSSCASQNGDLVDFAYNGSTGGGSNCTTSSPCPSLIVKGRRIVYDNNCNAIEADLYDYTTYDAGTQTGDWKGKQRMLHALGSSSTWTSVIFVAWQAWYFNYVTVGTLTDDQNHPPCPSTGYHAHHDFMLPTQSQYCQTTNNGIIPPKSPSNPSGFSKDWYRQNPDHYVHSLVHSYGVACVVPGPDAANFLLRSGGELDDTGAGTRSLAETGQPITTSSTCFTQSSWCGYKTVTKELLVAAYRNYQGMRPIDYLNAQQQSVPPSGSPIHYFWYGPDAQGYYLQFWWYRDDFPPSGHCYVNPGYQSLYWVDIYSSAGGSCNQQTWAALPSPLCPGCYSYGFSSDTGGGAQTVWSQYRGAGGLNPTLTPAQLQQEANAWVLSTDWAIVKPRVDAVIRAARNQKDMKTLGITANPGNSFDGRRW